MGKFSREKGKRGERRVRDLGLKYGIPCTREGWKQSEGDLEHPDVQFGPFRAESKSIESIPAYFWDKLVSDGILILQPRNPEYCPLVVLDAELFCTWYILSEAGHNIPINKISRFSPSRDPGYVWGWLDKNQNMLLFLHRNNKKLIVVASPEFLSQAIRLEGVEDEVAFSRK